MRNKKYHTVGTVPKYNSKNRDKFNTTNTYKTADFPGLVHPLSLLVAMLKTTFGSSSPPVVNRGAHVLFALFVFVFVW